MEMINYLEMELKNKRERLEHSQRQFKDDVNSLSFKEESGIDDLVRIIKMKEEIKALEHSLEMMKSVLK